MCTTICSRPCLQVRLGIFVDRMLECDSGNACVHDNLRYQLRTRGETPYERAVPKSQSTAGIVIVTKQQSKPLHIYWLINQLINNLYVILGLINVYTGKYFVV